MKSTPHPTFFTDNPPSPSSPTAPTTSNCVIPPSQIGIAANPLSPPTQSRCDSLPPQSESLPPPPSCHHVYHKWDIDFGTQACDVDLIGEEIEEVYGTDKVLGSGSFGGGNWLGLGSGSGSRTGAVMVEMDVQR